MNKTFFLASLAMIGSCLTMNGAQAASFSLSQGGSGSLITGGSYGNTFDAAPLFGSSLFTPGVDVISNATLTLNFTGANNQPALQGTESYVTASGIDGNGTGHAWQTTDTTNHYVDPLDSVNVLIGKQGGQTATGNDVANLFHTNVLAGRYPVYGTFYQSVTCHNFWGGAYECGYYYQNPVGGNRVYSDTTGYAGAFSVAATLDSASLGLFEKSGFLRYGFTVTSGGVALQSAILTFDAAPPPVSVSSVPVPAAAWLLGSGLVGLVGAARRKAA